jgi:antitoxin (DNA-binding transcriptional repressor) of toxin-antitoxin stability system
MIKKVNALKARQNLGRILEEVYYKGDQYIIERAGKPLAAMVPLWQLQARKEGRDHMLAKVQEVWRRTKKIQPESIEREVEVAVRALRTNLRVSAHDSSRTRRERFHKRHPERGRRTWENSEGLARRALRTGYVGAHSR